MQQKTTGSTRSANGNASCDESRRSIDSSASCLARIESARVERLKDELAAWRLAQEVREYVAVLRLQSESAAADDRERLTRWCDWAEAWSRRADPTVNIARVAGLDDERDRFSYGPTRSAFA